MINVQEILHEKMYKYMNQYLIFEQNMDLNEIKDYNFEFLMFVKCTS